MPLVFKASSIKRAFFWHCFFWIILFQFKPANRKSAFIELTSFQSLFLLNYQVSTLNESHHFLVKHSCESACGNLDAISARSAVRFFSQYCRWTRSHRGRHCDCAFYIHTLLMYTNTRLIEVEQRRCSKTPTPEVDQSLCACRLRRGSCLILERLVDVRNW